MNQVANPTRRNLLRGRIAKSSVEPKIRLPWVKSEAIFTDKCTQCDECIKHCETNIIVKDELGYPKIDFSNGECTFCQQCIEHCDQPLFIENAPFETEKAWLTAISIANNCLAANQVYCQSCRDECETSAISFKYANTSIPVPSIAVDDCTLCGAFVSKCPQSSIKITITKEEVNVR